MKTRCSKCRTNFCFEGICPFCGNRLVPETNSWRGLQITIGVCIALAVGAAFAFSILLGPQRLRPERSGVRSPRIVAPRNEPSPQKGVARQQGDASQKIYNVGVAPPVRNILEEHPLSLADMAKIRNLFLNRQFETLSRMADDIQKTFRTDPQYEYKIDEFFYVFYAPVADYERLLNEWVKAKPADFAPYLARAFFFERMAWHGRGYAYASKTSRKRFEQMHFYFREAATDARAALAINPNLLPAYLTRLDIVMTDGPEADQPDSGEHMFGGKPAIDAIYREAKSRFPDSFLLYFRMLVSKLPRWGGSYREAEKIAMDGYRHIHENPAFYVLFGEIYSDQAHVMNENHENRKALVLMDKAISYGDFYDFFQRRAYIYYDLKEYDKALKDLDRGIQLRPHTPELYRIKADVLFSKGDLKGALDMITFMETQFPGDGNVGQWRAWAAGTLVNESGPLFKTDLEQAAAKLSLALEVKPDYGDAYYWRGVAYSKLHKTDLARADLEQAIKSNPRDFKAYQMLDYLLSADRKWDEMLGNLNGFLALEPNNADAYFERAHTYWGKGDLKNAYSDLNHACALGNKKACVMLKGRHP